MRHVVSCRRGAVVALLSLTPIFPAAAQHAWIGVCPDSAAVAVDSAVWHVPVLWNASASHRLMVRAAAPAAAPGTSATVAARGCVGRSLPVDAHEVRWAGRLDAAALRGIELIGSFDAGVSLVASEVAPRPTTPTAATRSTPGFAEWPLATVRAFGSEERARIHWEDGALVLSCAAGERPAGVIVRADFHASPGTHVLVEYVATAAMEIGVLDAQREAAESPLTLGRLDARVHHGWLALPETQLDRRTWQAVSINCPATAAEMSVQRLVVREAPRPALRSTWFWAPAAWRSKAQDIFAMQARLALHVVYVGLDVDHLTPADADAFAQFVRSANERGLAVWVVLGDPGDARADGRATLERRLRALGAAQHEAPPAERIAGIQLDIEPYLQSGVESAPASWMPEYVRTVAAARRAWSGALDLVVPYWWSGLPEWTQLDAALALAPTVSLTVMNYRTSPVELRAAGTWFVDWGTRTHHAVQLALEGRPVADQLLRRYTPADSGVLWEVPLGAQSVLVLMAHAAPNPAGRAFALQFERPVRGSETSFDGDWEALLSAAAALSADLSRWPAFAGIAVHGLDEVSAVHIPWCLSCGRERR